MKRVYSRLFILGCFLFSFEIIPVNAVNYSNELLEANKMSVVWAEAPVSVSATVDGTTAVCINDISPTVTFTGSGGISPYTFTYKDKDGTEHTISSGASGVETLSVSTTTAGIFTYTLTSVKDKNGNVQNITGQVATITVSGDASFTFINNQCSGSAILFTPNAVGSYIYAWDFGDGTTSTEANPTHQFSTTGNSTASFTVKLTVSGNPSTCTQSATKTITLQQAPDPTLHANVESATDNGVPVFKTCSSSATDITFSNVSSTASSANASYTISWGDGTPDFTATTWNLQTHKYDLGLWTLTYTVTGQSGCSISRIYKVFIGSIPGGNLNNPGNTDICGDNTIVFPITGTESNPPGTVYTITFSDGSAPLTYIHPAPASVSHSFKSSSCGYTTLSGITNAFYATMLISNPCGRAESTVSPIYVSTPPKPSFSVQASTVCTNSSLCFTNTTTGSVEITNNGTGSSCDTALKTIWKITPSTGFTLGTGSFGNDFGTDITNQSLWDTGTTSICPIFTVPGTYTIAMKAANRCGGGEKDTTICVEAPLVPTFTLDQSEGCAPFSVKTTNTTDISKACKTPTYLWEVSYATGYCGTTSAYSFTSGTTSASESSSFQFTNPGIYTLKLTGTNTCGPQSITKTITVKAPPTVIINDIPDCCGPSTIHPTATINSCAPTTTGMTYAWSFPGGTPATSNAEVPAGITYNASGTYTVTLIAQNECGVQVTATKTFTVNSIPTVTNAPLTQTICSGVPTSLVTLTSSLANTTFFWIATATAGITGFTSSGTTNTIPVQTINSSSSTPGTVTYAITPQSGNCVGPVKNYVITVNPLPFISKQPRANTAVCKDGGLAVLSVDYANGTGVPVYQWYSNSINSTTGGTAITIGGTSNSYNPPTSTVDITYYYCVISFPDGGCSDIVSNTATVEVADPPIITAQPTPSQTACVDMSVAPTLSISYSGGAGTPTYSWYTNTAASNTGGTIIPGATGSSYTPSPFASTGTHYYYVNIDIPGSNCGSLRSDVATIVVVSDPLISEQPNSTQTICQGATPTDLKVSATGGANTSAYQWFGNSTDDTVSGASILGATNSTFTPPTTNVGTKYYYCIITQPDGKGCNVSSTAAEVIVTAPASITTQPISSAVCQGGTATTLSVAYTNGTGSPTYQWYSSPGNINSGGSPITGASAASFDPPTSTVGTTYYYCVVKLSPGGCSDLVSNTATVIVSPVPGIQTQPTASQDICVGGTTAVPLTAVYSGGAGTAAYQWYSNTTNSTSTGTLISGGTGTTYTPPAFTSIGTYYYYVQISLSGSSCGSVFSDPAKINVVADPVVTSQPLSEQILCQNATPSDLTLDATGGLGSFAYQWYQSATNNTTTGTAISGATAKTYTPSTAIIGTMYYYCVVSQPDGPGCSVTCDPAKVTINVSPSITTQPASNTVCLGDTPVLLKVAYINGVGTPQYQWYSNTTSSIIGGTLLSGETGDSYTPSFSTVGTSYYYCVITLSSVGCAVLTSNIAQITVNQYPIIAQKESVICSGATFTVTPGSLNGDIVPNGASYTWSSPIISPAGSIQGATAKSTPQVVISQTLVNTTSTVSTVTYTVTPLAGACPGATFNVVVTVYPILNPNTITQDISCYQANNGSIQTNISGGIPFTTGDPYRASWTGPNGFTSALTSISGLIPGIYTLTIQDAGNCPFTKSYTITEPTDVAITTETRKDVTCFGASNGLIGITVTGGNGIYNYAWTKDNAPFATTQDLSGLSPGQYTVTVTDGNNCGPKTASYTITEPPVLAVSLLSQTNILCFGDAIGAINTSVTGGTPIPTPSGVGYKYAWTGPNGYVSSNRDLTGLRAGLYQLTVTDNQGCTAMFDVTITQPSELTVTVTKGLISCYSENNGKITLNIRGGVKPYQIVWSNFGKGTVQENLSPGDYTVVVTDSNSCQKTLVINMPEAPLFGISPVVKDITCYGAHNGSIKLNFVGGTPPISFAWADDPTAGVERNNLGAGTYTITIHDAQPCDIVKTFVIQEPQPLVVSTDVTNALDCNNANSGAIHSLVSGGTAPFTYLWSTGATTPDLINITGGNYKLTVTDAGGCSQTVQVAVTRPLPLTFDVDSVIDLNCSTTIAKEVITVKVSGGLPPYQLVWSRGTISGANNEIIETTENGLVILTVTDALGCTASYSYDVDIPDYGIDYKLTDCNNHNYQFDAIVQNDLDNNSYSWNFGDGGVSTIKSPVHTYSAPGMYKVALTASNSTCSSLLYEKTITVEAVPVLTLDRNPVFCIGDSMVVHVAGAYSYRWSNESTADSIVIKKAGEYSVTGTSKAGCTTTLKFTASNFDLINYTLQTDKTIISTEDPTVQMWSEAVPFSQYYWDFGDGTTVGGNNPSHTYDIMRDGYFDVNLKVINPNGCVERATKRIWITSPKLPNTFSPNGDGKNDVYMKGWHMQIFNRNGVLLYEGTDGWDGKYKGENVTNGTYFYVIKYPTESGHKTNTGFITLIR
jgi:gliding motility-associated-like protein